MRNNALALSNEDLTKFKRGIEPVFENLSQAKALAIFVTETAGTIDNASNKSLVDMANKAIPNVADAYKKLADFTAEYFKGFLNTLARTAQTTEDEASVKQVKTLLTKLEDMIADYTKVVKANEDVKVTLSLEVKEPPIDISKVVTMVESYKAIPSDLAEAYDKIQAFRKEANATKFLEGNPSAEESLNKFQKQFTDIVNEELIPVVEGFANNSIEFLQKYEETLTREQKNALDQFKAIFAKYKGSISENKSTAKKTKAEFKAPKGM